MKRLLTLFAIITLMIIPIKGIHAEEKEAGVAAVLANRVLSESEKVDQRVIKLKRYLEAIGSPMAESAYHFVAEADRLNMDWKLVAAIAGNESYFGAHIPYNSYNGWGWGVWTGTNYGANFSNWNDGITTVSEGLKYNYIDRGAVTLEQIGHIYAADRNWSYKVQHFMDEIEAFQPSSRDQLDLVS